MMPPNMPASRYTQRLPLRVAVPTTRHTNQPASETRKRPGSAITRMLSGSPASSRFTTSPIASMDGIGLVWRTGKPPPMLSKRGFSPLSRILRNTRLAFSMPTRQFSGLRHCEPTWNVTPARSALRSAAAAMISSASLGWTPNFPDSGQSLPAFGSIDAQVELGVRLDLDDLAQLLEAVQHEPLHALVRRVPQVLARLHRIAVVDLRGRHAQARAAGRARRWRRSRSSRPLRSRSAAPSGADWPSPRSADGREAWRP